MSSSLLQTPLHAFHLAHKARMCPFAGYEMPLSYAGTLAEHHHVRSTEESAGAGLFDVSHMGQIFLQGETVVEDLEKLVVGDLKALPMGKMRYSVLTTSEGGVIDDLMITKVSEDTLFLVVNASRKDIVIPHLRQSLSQGIELTYLPNHALIALQGPHAERAMKTIGLEVAQGLAFMESTTTSWQGHEIRVTRCGYTGEDGFEMSVEGGAALTFAEALVALPFVAPIGLGARDTLRLEAGLCLYGHELDETITPIEADLLWIMSKRRRTEGGFLGEKVILSQINEGVSRVRVGLRPLTKQPVREGYIIADTDQNPLGKVTSGGFSPTLDGPVAMGYLDVAPAGGRPTLTPGRKVLFDVRGKWVEGEIVALPFVPHRYKRST